MKKCTLYTLLLLAMPAFATISQVQSAAKWTCGTPGQTVTCVINTTTDVSANNLLAVWTFWESSNGSGGTYPYTAGVDDNGTGGGHNQWYSAVGPTFQSAASTPTTAQLFYAKKINASSGGSSGDPIKVTYSCLYSPGPPATGNPACTTTPSIALAGVVVVEYSGADTMYPLDSVSAGYSYGTGALLDSGTAAPANANLLVFGGGTSDGGSASAGSGFTAVQSNGGSVTEQMIVSGNNVLQRATAGLTGVGSPANWLMQMAVFRAASWGLAEGSPVFTGQSSVSNNGAFSSGINNYQQSLINGFNPSTAYGNSATALQGASATGALVGGIIAPSTSTVVNALGVTGLAVNEAGSTSNVAGLYGSAQCLGNNQGCWGSNPLVGDTTNDTGGSTNGDAIVGQELDVGVQGKPRYVYGESAIMTGSAMLMPAQSFAFVAISNQANTWNSGFYSSDKAAGVAFFAGGNGCTALGICNSQPVFFNSYNGSSPQSAQIYEDELGNLLMQPVSTASAAGSVRIPPVTFSKLTACGPTMDGSYVAITDSTVNTTWGQCLNSGGTGGCGKGGGMLHVLLYCDGTNWTVAAK